MGEEKALESWRRTRTRAARTLAGLAILAAWASGCTSEAAVLPVEPASWLPTVIPSSAAAPAFADQEVEPLPMVPENGCGSVQHDDVHERRHVENGTSWAYPEWPVSGGPHDERWLTAGVYGELADAPAGSAVASRLQAVHSLEHGYVIILHRADLPQTDVDEIVATWAGRHKVIIAPVEEAASEVVLLAWERRRYCRGVDHEGIDQFLTAYVEGPAAPEPSAG